MAFISPVHTHITNKAPLIPVNYMSFLGLTALGLQDLGLALSPGLLFGC